MVQPKKGYFYERDSTKPFAKGNKDLVLLVRDIFCGQLVSLIMNI